MALKMLAGTKTITTIQADSIYKERWTANPGDPWPANSQAHMQFLDSSGGVIADIEAESVDSRYITFRRPYADVAEVPNGAGFRCFLSDPAEPIGEHMVRYGSVFRRENFFPHSPSEVVTFEPKKFTDTFQRPPGRIGNRWTNLLGQPNIYSNKNPFYENDDLPNSLGTNYNFFSRYFTRYNWAFAGDSIELSVSALDKGNGKTMIAICSNSDGTSFLGAMINSASSTETVTLGIGHGVDINVGANFEPMTGAFAAPVPFVSNAVAPANYKMKFDEATKTFGFYTDTWSPIVEWTDDDDLVPHGRGYRYFAIAANSGLIDSGVQLTYISASDVV